MINALDITERWNSIVTWCGSIFWTTNTLYQGVIIIGAFIIGTILYRLARRKTRTFIESRKIHGAVKRVCMNLERLLFPLITLTLIFIATRLAGSSIMGVDVTLTEGMMKVLLAWIVIRIAVQFIANAAIRNFFALVIWCIAALSIFGLLNHTMTSLESFAFTIGDFRLSALAVIKSILMLVGLLYFAIFVSGFAERRIYQIKSLTRSSQVLISKITRVTLTVFALIIGVTSAGIDLSIFAVFGGAIGLGIGFGLQKGISNLFSGMLLLLDKSIKPGDVIELENGTFGWVNHMAARYTEIVTRDNKSFLIPNEEFITSRMVNWSHGNSLIRLEVTFGVHYNSNPHDVKALAESAAALAHDRICSDPSPVCHLTEFGDSALNFKLRFWITDAEKGVTNMRSAVMLALWDAFKDNDIAIPYPHREIFIHETNRDKKAQD